MIKQRKPEYYLEAYEKYGFIDGYERVSAGKYLIKLYFSKPFVPRLDIPPNCVLESERVKPSEGIKYYTIKYKP